MEENKTTATGTENNAVTGTEQTENKTYTAAEVESMVDARISKAYEKWQKKASAQVSEADKLARMSESEKASYEISQREKTLAEKEKALAVQENKISAAKVMSEKGISLAFLDFIVSDDADAMMENIKTFQKELAKNVEAEVRKRMASGTPKVGGGTTEITPDVFRKMSLSSKQQLMERDKELFDRLSKQ